MLPSPNPAPPPILVLNVVFGKIVPNPTCIPNLKLLASTVAEIRRASHFLDAPLAQPPSNFGPKRCFGKQQPVPKWSKNFVTTATVCFKQKSNICIAKFGNLGVNGAKGSKFIVENVKWHLASPALICLFTMQLLWG